VAGEGSNRLLLTVLMDESEVLICRAHKFKGTGIRLLRLDRLSATRTNLRGHPARVGKPLSQIFSSLGESPLQDYEILYG